MSDLKHSHNLEHKHDDSSLQEGPAELTGAEFGPNGRDKGRGRHTKASRGGRSGDCGASRRSGHACGRVG